jgi:LPXTG-site transpeptidase (sortase) family protein
MVRKKSPQKPKTDRKPRGRSARQAATPIEPTLVNGIKDEAAANALSPDPAAIPAKKTSRSRRAAKPKKPAKVVHPKATITFRRNILPPILGVLMTLGVLGLLNGQWLVAQYQYRFVDRPSSINLSTNPATTDPNAPPRIFIPKINVSAPVITDTKTYDQGPVQLALRRGVVQYGTASASPGQKGNTVLIGHSSGQLWAPGDYKFVFTMLDKLVNDDRILVDYKGTRYIYRVSESKVVPPTDLSVLRASDTPELTLITCTPVGSSKNRLVITARQISPKPETATAMSADQARPAIGITIPN